MQVDNGKYTSPHAGFAIITWNNPKKKEKPYITKGLATCQSLGSRFSHVTFGSYGGPRHGSWKIDGWNMKKITF